MYNNMIEQDINRIRLEIYEKTKGMTPEQRVAHTRKATDECQAHLHIDKYYR